MGSREFPRPRSRSAYDAGPLTFAAPAGSDDVAMIDVLGLDDELPAAVPITVTLNGAVLYQRDSPFPTWDPDATGNQWGSMTFDIPAGTLLPTGNELAITNDAPSGLVSTPPWVMVVAITVAR